MQNSRATEIVTGLTTLGALAFMVFSTCEWPSSPDRKLHTAIGKAMAREALNLLADGGQILVITRDTTAFRQPAADILLGSFKKEVRKAHATIAATQLIQVDPLRPVQVPSGDFVELIRKAPSGSVIVSFMGPPLLTEEQRSQLGAIKPRIVAFCSGNLPDYVDLRALFDRQLLHAAVVSRRNSEPPPSKAKAWTGSFDQLYMTATAADHSSLPTPSGVAPKEQE